jgi:Protein of unknown function (DUF2934)
LINPNCLRAPSIIFENRPEWRQIERRGSHGKAYAGATVRDREEGSSSTRSQASCDAGEGKSAMKRITDLVSREDRIRLRAGELNRERGDRPGSALADWLCAEREIEEADQRSIDEALSPSGDPPTVANPPEAERKNREAESQLLGDQGQSGG